MNISGSVIYSPDSQQDAKEGNLALPGIPVALQAKGDVAAVGAYEDKGIVSITNDAGEYLFKDVVAGDYRVVEAAGYAGITKTGASWNDHGLILVTPEDPPITIVHNPPEGADALVSISPNTVFVSVDDKDISGIHFYDAPKKNAESVADAKPSGLEEDTESIKEDKEKTVVMNSISDGYLDGPAVPFGDAATQNYLQVTCLREQFVCGKKQINLGNVITQSGLSIVYNPSNRDVLLQQGTAFYVSYKIVIEASNCRSRINIATGILYQDAIYQGSVSTNSLFGTGTVELSASVIINTGGQTQAFSLVNLTGYTVSVTGVTLNIIQLA